MKILGMAVGGIVVIAAIAITITFFSNSDQINEDKIRVAFFPSIGHIIPVSYTHLTLPTILLV